MRKASIGLAMVAAGAMLALPSMAAAAPTATASYQFTPNKLNSPAKVVFNTTIANPDGSVPPPVTQIVAHLPAGMVISGKGIGSCSLATLNSKGSSACPKNSVIANVTAVAQADIGGTLINESATGGWFLGPNEPGALLSGNMFTQGTTPIAVTVIVKTVLVKDSSPYGYKVVSTIPAIPTVPGGPNASIVSVKLTSGFIKKVKKRVHGKMRTVTESLITTPKTCPKGGFKWGEDNTYADGSTTSLTTTTKCPAGRSSGKKGHHKKATHRHGRHH